MQSLDWHKPRQKYKSIYILYILLCALLKHLKSFVLKMLNTVVKTLIHTLTAETAVYYRAWGGASVWHSPRDYYSRGGGATGGVIQR